MQNIFCCEEDFKTAMWTLAASRHIFKGVQVLTFELMSNHVHLILAGQREECIKAFELFAAKLRQAFPKRQRAIDWSKFKMEIMPIESIQALRNEIIYVNRNAFVANPAYTPDSYPWGGGCAYFCPWLKYLVTKPLGKLPILTQRTLLHTKKITPFADLKVIDNALHPFFLRHQSRRKHVQRCAKLLQFTNPQCRSIQPDSLPTQRRHLPHRRGTLLSDMLTHQQRVLSQDTLTTQRPAKDRHRPPHAL